MKKRKLLRLSAIPIIGATILFSFSTEEASFDYNYSTEGLDLFYTVPNLSDMVKGASNLNVYPELGNGYLGFKEALAFKESRGDYAIINQFGYLGKYQFNKNTLKMVGVYDTNEFMNNPELQEKAFLAYTSRNKWVLRRDIKRSVGKVINGVKITESGILAAAHLSGPGSVKKYLRSGGVTGFSDAFGTTIDYYMKKFGGYDMSFVKQDKMAKVN
jgi:hypothetical protein